MYGADPLGPEAIAAVDTDGVLGEVLDLGEHLRDALWRVQSANLAPEPTPGGLAVVGVDGLERGGALAADALAAELAAPLTVTRATPAPTAAPATLLLASYSGDDAAVLEAFARAEHTRPVVLTTGGQLAIVARRVGVPVIPLPGGFPQPLLAAGYTLVVCLELARLGGLAESSAAAVELAAAHVARLAREWGPESPEDSGAKRLAHAAVEDRDPDWAPSPVEAGETPLQQAVTRLLLDNLVDLYTQVLRARSQP
jgi:glucose/mannose-6-phosphate isomerase